MVPPPSKIWIETQQAGELWLWVLVACFVKLLQRSGFWIWVDFWQTAVGSVQNF